MPNFASGSASARGSAGSASAGTSGTSATATAGTSVPLTAASAADSAVAAAADTAHGHGTGTAPPLTSAQLAQLRWPSVHFALDVSPPWGGNMLHGRKTAETLAQN